MNRRLVWYPLAVAMFPIFFLYFSNRASYPMSALEMAWPILIALVVTLGLQWIMTRLMRDADRAALAVAVLVTMFFSFGRLNFLLDYVGSTLTGVFLAILYLLFLVIIQLKRVSARRLTPVLTFISIGLVVAQPLLYLLTPSRQQKVSTSSTNVATAATGPKPDIYVLLLDGYPRADILERVYHFDNSGFIGELQDRGFYVADQSHSNYPQTTLSVASLLNMDYIQNLITPYPTGSADRQPLDTLIKHSRVASALHDQGYTSVAFATGYPYTDLKTSDVFLEPRRVLSEFQFLLVSTTPIPAVLRYFHDTTIQEGFRQRMDFVFDQLPTVAKKNVPTFTYAHIVAPHPPFVVMADGQPTTDPSLIRYHDGDWWARNETERAMYQQYLPQQVVYVNGRTLSAIDAIKKNSSEPPIIIVLSDHGGGSEWHVNDLEATNIPERFSNLTALLLPGASNHQPSADITPVNIFRLILSRYFAANLLPLESRSYFATESKPFDLSDVTNRLTEGRAAGG